MCVCVCESICLLRPVAVTHLAIRGWEESRLFSLGQKIASDPNASICTNHWVWSPPMERCFPSVLLCFKVSKAEYVILKLYLQCLCLLWTQSHHWKSVFRTFYEIGINSGINGRHRGLRRPMCGLLFVTGVAVWRSEENALKEFAVVVAHFRRKLNLIGQQAFHQELHLCKK